MNPALIAALIQQVALPEIVSWLKSKHDAGETVDDAAIVAKLEKDRDAVIAEGQAWLDAHPGA